MIEMMLRALIFAASVAGYLMLLNKKYDIAMEFAPAIYCSSVSSVMFVAGILNIMPGTAAAITIGGLLCTIWGIRNKLHFSRRTWIVTIGFGVVLLYFVWLLKDAQFDLLDTFSHWALVIREMLIEDRMPNFTDRVVIFQAYPMGSSVWGYYVCRTIGAGEEWFLVVQQVMFLSYLLPLFVWLTKEKWCFAALPVSFGIYAMCSNIPITELMVDSLMPAAAVALFCMAAYYRNEVKKAIWCAAPMLVFLLQVKSSGVYFVVLFIVYIAVVWGKNLVCNKSLGRHFLTLDVLLPFAGLLLWNRHVKLVFEAGETSLHAMTSEYLTEVYLDKSAEEIRTIIFRVLNSAVSVKNSTYYLLLILTAGIGCMILYSVCRKKAWKNWAGLLCMDWLAYFLYVLGLLGTYLFSMDGNEATELAAFDRYMQTFGIFLYGLNAVQIMQNVEIKRGTVRKLTAVLCVLASILPFCHSGFPAFQYGGGWSSISRRKDDSATILTAVRQHEEAFGGMPDYMSYSVYFKNASVSEGNLEHRLRYEFRSDEFTFFDDFSDYHGDISGIDADFLYIWTPDEDSDAFLRANGLEDKCGEQVIINLMGLG